MSAIKSIHTSNIQSHKDVLIEMPESGIVVLAGDNSNGKSVIRKVLEDTIYDNIKNPKVRKSLINKDVSEGYLEIKKYDGTILHVNINLEASLTWAKLTRPSGEEVTRYLADKTIPDLVREFGFHHNESRGVSLNICDSDDSILFFRTKHVANADVLNSALVDTDAQQKYEILKETYAQAINLRQGFNDNVRVSRVARSSMVMYDIEKETAIRDSARKCLNLLSHTYVPDIKELEPIPEVLFLDLPVVRLRKVAIPTFLDLPPVHIKDLRKDQAELDDLEKGVCPTCQRPFSSCQTSTSET